MARRLGRLPRSASVVVGAAVTAVLLVACGEGDEVDLGETGASLEVTSDVLAAGDEVPTDHTCDGADEPVPLDWAGVPGEAEEVVVIVEDPDAPDGTFTHWLVAGLPGEDGALGPEGVPTDAVEGENDFGSPGWAGPCPPEGDGAHTYRFRVLALDAATGLEPGFDAAALEAAVADRAIAEGMLEATYAR